MVFAAVVGIVVGTGMLIQWAMLFATRQIPELQHEPIRIWFHIAGEVATAVLLIAGGIGLLMGLPGARTTFFVSMGMLLYTAIVSPGYFAQQGKWGWLAAFAVLVGLSVAAVIAVSVGASG